MDLVKYARNQWDRIGAWLCVIGGAVALLVGYLGVSDTLNTGEQLPYVVSGGMVGLFLLGLGALLWLSADLRDEWRKLDRLEQLVRGEAEVEVDQPAETNGASATDTEPAPRNGSRKRRAAPQRKMAET